MLGSSLYNYFIILYYYDRNQSFHDFNMHKIYNKFRKTIFLTDSLPF